MPDLKTPLLWLLGIALLLALATAGVERTRRMDLKAEFSDYKARGERAAREEGERQREIESVRRKAIDKEVQHAQEQAREAVRHVAAAADAGKRLRDELSAARRSQACGDPATASGGQTAGTPANLLELAIEDVQRRLDEAADDLARYAQDAARAGNACQRSYQALTP